MQKFVSQISNLKTVPVGPRLVELTKVERKYLVKKYLATGSLD